VPPYRTPCLAFAILLSALLTMPPGASGQPPGAADLAGMKLLDRLIAAVDLAQSGPPRGRDSRPSGIFFESRERLHIIYGSDPAVLRQRAIVNLLTNEVTWFPVPSPLTAPPAEPLPVTSWSRDHVLLLETPQGQRELYRSDCPNAQVFVRHQGMAVIYGCRSFTVVDLQGHEILTDHFSALTPVPFAFNVGGERLRVTLRESLPDGTAAPAVLAIVDYEIRSGKRSDATAVSCPRADLCTLSYDGALAATVSDEGLVQVYSDSTDRPTKPASSIGSTSLATIRFRVHNGNDPVPHAVVRFQSVLQSELNLQFESDSSGRVYVDTIPNSVYCMGVIDRGRVTPANLGDIYFPRGVTLEASWRPSGAGPPARDSQESVCSDVLAGKWPAFQGKTRIAGTVHGFSLEPPVRRRACFQNLLLPDLRFEFDIGDDGRFSGEIPEGFYRVWLGAPAGLPSFSGVAAFVGPNLVVNMSEHDPGTEAEIWGELKDGSGQTVCLRSELAQQCMETNRLGQYAFHLPLGSYDTTITRAGKIVWTKKLVLTEPGEYRDPIHLP